MLKLALVEIADYGQQLDTPLKGEAYFKSREKLLFDRYGAKILLPAAYPLIAISRLAVWATQKGKDGDCPTIAFEQQKIRSMVSDPESADRPALTKDPNDTRITTVGRVLRRWSIDELLQLHNVKNGDMSLVGHRPKSEPEFRQYCQLDSDFEPAYTIALPGITGLEQVNGRADLSPSQRIEFEKEYAAEACLALDCDILLKTAGAVLRGNGAY